jgi:hypothetical protein
MTHPSIVGARKMIERLKDREVEWEVEKASRDPFEPDVQEAWNATRSEPKLKTVRDLQVSTEEFEARIGALRDELVTMINDNVAALREELDALADGAGEEVGKMNRQLDKLEKALTNVGPRLVKSNDAA